MPEKVTQEELRFMRMIAEWRSQWFSLRRGFVNYTDAPQNVAQDMENIYEKIQNAAQIATLFAPRRRVEQLTSYAKNHSRAVIYYCETKRVR